MIARNTILLVGLFLLTAAASTEAKLPKEQIYSLYNQANQYFRQGNSTNEPEKAKRLYEGAILSLERIIEEGQIKNAKLYYNLGNAYLLHGQLGKAIMNYRRAAKIGNYDNIQKNLAFARSKRIDKVATKTEKRILQTLFFWHYDFSLKIKFLLTCIFFAILCLCITVVIWLGRSAPWTVTTAISVILTICFLVSVIVESNTIAYKICGVITAKEVIARQGVGQSYQHSFKEPLHEGTEFNLLENRYGWFRIKLSDDSEGWIPEASADLI